MGGESGRWMLQEGVREGDQEEGEMERLHRRRAGGEDVKERSR